MTDTDDWQQWRGATDGRIGTLEERVKIEAFARAGIEMDVHSLWPKAVAANKLLEALRATQSEHTATLARHTRMHEDHTKRLTRLEDKVDTLSVDMGSVKGDVSTLKGDVSTLKGDVSTLKGDVKKILELLASRS